MELKAKSKISKPVEKKNNLTKAALLKKELDGDFWEGKSFAELTKEQGVKPFDMGDSGKNWPKDADFDSFMRAIKSGRK